MVISVERRVGIVRDVAVLNALVPVARAGNLEHHSLLIDYVIEVSGGNVDRIYYQEIPAWVFGDGRLPYGVYVELDVIRLVRLVVGVCAVPVAFEGGFVLVVSGPQDDGSVVLQATDLCLSN